ncbi:hypothetical protein CNMCM8980_001787 [Aspergillus fumigatiaffinis]|uniref:Uncharacterized protein n=1 Tax=Aspergillus fumigatiaffinis TaxID=340414 RepID=A0A8H4GYZ0_9EURO|nr:hypothetical protein CNMCM6457_000788 [Aspergillus fumigatiaffinis]KAF4231079.1 hypothetical protein CNMCM6805_000311 [Aspergillus fumigatiaffinis]KAF4239212.1 hypothetical protein CNMCM8980_001787 [Aspergillus fumigatiaffinis]
MRFQFLLAATVGALQVSHVVATALPVTSDPHSLSERDTEAGAPAVNTPAVQIDEPELLDLEEVESDPSSHLAKRSVLGQLQLMADTGNRYRIRANGVTIFLHIFYDLARETCVFYWTADQASIPGSISFGLQDTTTGKTVQVQPFHQGGRWKWAGAKLYDIINVLI